MLSAALEIGWTSMQQSGRNVESALRVADRCIRQEKDLFLEKFVVNEEKRRKDPKVGIFI